MVDKEKLAQILSVGEPGTQVSDQRLHALHALAKQMGDNPPNRDAPVREVVARVGDNWSALILKVLATGTYRHATLKRTIATLSAEGDISQRMLTLRLRALERDGFVQRTTLPSVPPRVEYALTPLGHAITAQLNQMIQWIEAHEAEILAARAAYSE
jgi:DNA-binding HxlR family transcriptional regulator